MQEGLGKSVKIIKLPAKRGKNSQMAMAKKIQIKAWLS
jgi:hypothetical protein